MTDPTTSGPSPTTVTTGRVTLFTIPDALGRHALCTPTGTADLTRDDMHVLGEGFRSLLTTGSLLGDVRAQVRRNLDRTGQTQRALAARAGVTEKHVSRVLRGHDEGSFALWDVLLRESVSSEQPPESTCGHPDTWFDRTLCPEPCGSMHDRCTECGVVLGRCRLDEPSGNARSQPAVPTDRMSS